MDVFSVNFTHNELNFIRQCLELPSISGKDAKFLASLQTKIEQELIEIEQKKAEDLKKAIEAEQTK